MKEENVLHDWYRYIERLPIAHKELNANNRNSDCQICVASGLVVFAFLFNGPTGKVHCPVGFSGLTLKAHKELNKKKPYPEG